MNNNQKAALFSFLGGLVILLGLLTKNIYTYVPVIAYFTALALFASAAVYAIKAYNQNVNTATNTASANNHLKSFLSMALGGVIVAILYGLGQYLIKGHTDILHLFKFTITFLAGGSIGYIIAVKMMNYKTNK